MGCSKCDLYLENYTDYFAGGQTIVGYALCTFVEPKEVHGIVVKIKGEATTHWRETKSKYNSATKRHEPRTVSYHGAHQIISEEIDLLNRGETTIPEGVHKYPFVYKLPDDLPSTYQHSWGRIDYTIKAVVKRPLLKFNYEAESILLINTPLNLNNFPSFRNAQSRHRLKETFLCCWNKGNINVTANIPKAGFVLGERLPLHLQVENLSQANIEEIRVKVKAVQKFTVSSPSHKTRTDRDSIYTDTYPGVGAHGENTYEKAILINNAALVLNYINANIIINSYELKITFVLSGIHTNIDLEIPIIVGQVPFIVRRSVPPGPSYNIGFIGPGVREPPPVYIFTTPQPVYNPNNAIGMTGLPPYCNPTEEYPPRIGVLPVLPGTISGIPETTPTKPGPISGMSGTTSRIPGATEEMQGAISGIAGPSAPSAPSAPMLEASAPSKDKSNTDEWELVDDSLNQDLPTYDQALKNEQKM